MNFRFPKSEKLKSSKTIELLFAEGQSFSNFPLKVIYLPQQTEQTTQATFAVPKRNFKTAVMRNRIKRQLREVYRLNKALVLTNNGKNFALLFLYISKDRPRYSELEKAMKMLLKKLYDENN